MIDASAVDAVLQHILPAVKAHQAGSSTPFILGLSGLQGSGKSTWAAALTETLNAKHGVNTRTLSLDDLYHDHDQLVALRESNPGNGLLRTRGQPGTHDEELARRFFDDVCQPSSSSSSSSGSFEGIKWPSFDKSLFSGEGGRVPVSEWEIVPRSPPLEVLIFEGWCLGFQPLSADQVEEKWNKAKAASSKSASSDAEAQLSTTTLAAHSLEHLLLINKNLERYCEAFMGPWRFNAFLHLSTDQLVNVYHWRLDQERALREKKGAGMTDAQVIRFVQGYMPAYELYLDRLTRESFFTEEKKAHVRVILDSNRTVLRVEKA